ncbi:MAG: hypothetical protein HKN30_06845 [Sulfitobacter sp.]|nr:hypothetical protein [Sulfitobacter sp.]
MSQKPPLSWTFRRIVWNSVSLLIFRFKKAKHIPLPPQYPRPLKLIPVSERIPGVQVDHVMMADRIPKGESSLIMRASFTFRIWLGQVLPPVVPGLPQIDADMDKAMRRACNRHYRALYPAPRRPEAFRVGGMPDLGEMAVASPYACFLEKDGEGNLVWDFRDLDDHEVHPGLRPLGSRVFFKVNKRARKLEATRIECVLGEFRAGEDRWDEAVRTAMCAASTQISLVNHFNGVHLACGGPLSVATRNHLYSDHALCRLMWPHMFGTQNSNYLVTKGQMLPMGDFETIFSFTHEGMCDLFSRSYKGYRASVMVPGLDWERRGLPVDQFDTPVQDNLSQLYEVMHAHTTRYINIYYDSDQALQRDETVQAWIAALNKMIPNGVDDVTGGEVTRESVARLCAGFIYMASVQHEALGSCMWNYQMWVDKNPVRIHTNGQRIPIDVFQRLLNANFNLNVDRAKLMQDFSYFAIDGAGASAFKQFDMELRALERELDGKAYAAWRITPKMLEANINA